jgi:ATP-dependent protease ClpP protease subunit
MYHQVSSGTGGKLKDMQEDLEETARLQQIINDHTFSKTNITQKKLDKNFKDKKDWFIAGEDLIKLGIVDKII